MVVVMGTLKSTRAPQESEREGGRDRGGREREGETGLPN